MKDKLVKGLEIILALIIVIGLFVVSRQSSDYKKGQQDYSEAEQIANLTGDTEILAPSAETVLTQPTLDDPYAAMLKEKINFPALKEVNSDVLGWIEIPGTELSYPILQGEDNDFYLNHTWKKEPNSVGSIYLECQVDPEFIDFNTIIYGHRMRNLSMFGSLKYYQDISYWEEHPSVYVVTEGDVYRYDIYAAYKADPKDIIYGLKINSRPKKQEVIQFGLESSVIETGIVPTTYDRILTLSTCTGSGHASRWVVQAVYRVEASDAPESTDEIFEGTDDAADSRDADTNDTFIPKDTENTECLIDAVTLQKLNLIGVYLQVVLLVGLVIMAVVQIIITLIRNFRKKD